MKICPACHRESPVVFEKDKFCPHCGHVLVEKIYPNCVHCGAVVLDSFRFCMRCGKPRAEALNTPTASPE